MEEYDHIVEEIYLTAINSRDINKRCFNLLMQEIESGKDLHVLEYYSALFAAANDAGVPRPGAITTDQYMKAWARIKSDLTEPVLYELGIDIADAIQNGRDLLNEAQAKYEKQIQQTLETNIMSELQNTAIETVTYVYGKDIKKMNSGELIAAIERTNGEIKKLKDVDVKSKHIDSQVTKLEEAVNSMVEHLDAL